MEGQGYLSPHQTLIDQRTAASNMNYSPGPSRDQQYIPRCPGLPPFDHTQAHGVLRADSTHSGSRLSIVTDNTLLLPTSPFQGRNANGFAQQNLENMITKNIGVGKATQGERGHMEGVVAGNMDMGGSNPLSQQCSGCMATIVSLPGQRVQSHHHTPMDVQHPNYSNLYTSGSPPLMHQNPNQMGAKLPQPWISNEVQPLPNTTTAPPSGPGPRQVGNRPSMPPANVMSTSQDLYGYPLTRRDLEKMKKTARVKPPTPTTPMSRPNSTLSSHPSAPDSVQLLSARPRPSSSFSNTGAKSPLERLPPHYGEGFPLHTNSMPQQAQTTCLASRLSPGIGSKRPLNTPERHYIDGPPPKKGLFATPLLNPPPRQLGASLSTFRKANTAKVNDGVVIPVKTPQGKTIAERQSENQQEKRVSAEATKQGVHALDLTSAKSRKVAQEPPELKQPGHASTGGMTTELADEMAEARKAIVRRNNNQKGNVASVGNHTGPQNKCKPVTDTRRSNVFFTNQNTADTAGHPHPQKSDLPIKAQKQGVKMINMEKGGIVKGEVDTYNSFAHRYAHLHGEQGVNHSSSQVKGNLAGRGGTSTDQTWEKPSDNSLIIDLTDGVSVAEASLSRITINNQKTNGPAATTNNNNNNKQLSFYNLSDQSSRSTNPISSPKPRHNSWRATSPDPNFESSRDVLSAICTRDPDGGLRAPDIPICPWAPDIPAYTEERVQVMWGLQEVEQRRVRECIQHDLLFKDGSTSSKTPGEVSFEIIE